MGTPILGPKDTAVGDLIELRQPYRNVVCKVVRASAGGMTVQPLTGAKVRLPYTEARLGAVSVLTCVNFYNLDARARWLAATPDGVIADAARGFVSIVLTADDMRDLPATTARLTKLKAWIDAEPKAATVQPTPKPKPKPPKPRRRRTPR